MSRPRRFRWLRFVPLLAVLVLGIVWGRKALTPPLHVARFADGTTVTVHRIDWGPSTYVEGAWWQQLLVPILPARWGPRIHEKTDLQQTTPVLWLSETGPIAKQWFAATVFDELGNETLVGVQHWAVSGGDVYPMPLNPYPRRSHTLGIRFWRWDGKRLGELRLKNPRLSQDPQQIPERLPARRSLAGSRVSLVGFRTGLPSSSHDAFARETEMLFEVSRGGATDETWIPVGASVTDATGNRFDLPSKMGRERRGPLHRLYFEGNLFQSEQGYHIQVAWARSVRARFSASELWTLRDIPMPRFGERTPLSRQTRFGAARLTAVELSREYRDGRPELQIQSNSGEFNPHVSLVSAVDDRGRKLQVRPDWEDGLSFGPDFTLYSLPFTRGINAKSVTLTLALQYPKWVEFTAAPTWPAKKGASTAAK
ncbi:MAG: hypothetical protein ACK47B_12120 [Armatimonadota bacterium]